MIIALASHFNVTYHEVNTCVLNVKAFNHEKALVASRAMKPMDRLQLYCGCICGEQQHVNGVFADEHAAACSPKLNGGDKRSLLPTILSAMNW